MTTRRLFLGSLAAAAALPAFAGSPLQVRQPWARAALEGRTSAVYMTIETTAATADRLLAAATPLARTVELHAHVMDGAVMRMRPVEAIEVKPGEPALLRPGDLHIMLIGLTRPLTAGQTIPLTLRFEKAGEITVDVPVLAAGASGPSGHEGGHRRH